MFLQKLAVTNFKNYEEAVLQFSDKINCFIGDNGSGKTNLLDANMGAVDLTNANLTNANLTGTNAPDHLILRAKSLFGTVMPDGMVNEQISGGKDAGPQP